MMERDAGRDLEASSAPELEYWVRMYAGPIGQYLYFTKIALPYWINKALEYESKGLKLCAEVFRLGCENHDLKKEVTQLRATLFCKEPGCINGHIDTERLSDYGVMHYNSIPCPTCGELRKALKEGK